MGDGTPTLIGDVMLSTEDRTFREVNYPTKPRGVAGKKRDYLVPGLCQKIMYISPDIIIAYAGTRGDAEDFVNYIELRANGGAVSRERIMEDFRQFFDHRSNGLQAMMLHTDEKSGALIGNNHVTFEHKDLGAAMFIGTGTHDMFEYANTNTTVSYAKRADAPVGARHIWYALNFVQRAMYRQNNTGFGLSSRWGGGFEIVVSRDRKLVKLDRIMFQHYFYHRTEKGLLSVQPFGARIFQCYRGDELLVFTQHRKDGVQGFVVPRLTKLQQEVLSPFHTTLPSSPQMTCSTFLDRERKRPPFFDIRYHESGDPNAFLRLKGRRSEISYSHTFMEEYLAVKYPNL